MNKTDVVKINIQKLTHLMRSNNAPEWLQDELCTLTKYSFSDSEWLENATYQELSNGYFVGEFHANGKRNGKGMYVWNDGDIYLGGYYQGNEHGAGLYYSAQKTLIYFSNDWKDGEKNGYGCVWGPGYESQGYYQNDREIRNDYVKNGSGYHPNVPVNNDNDGFSFIGCLVIIIIGILVWWIFF